MFRKLSISVRLTVLILIAAGGILGAVVGYSYLSARGMLEAELTSKAQHMALATASQIEGVTTAVETAGKGLAVTVNSFSLSKPQAYQLLEDVVKENRAIYGAAIAWAPPTAEYGKIQEVPYVYRQVSGLGSVDLAKSYDYAQQDWFKKPQELRHAVWSEPYFDQGGGNILMCTYSIPLFSQDDEKKFKGVVTCDVSLNWLSSLLISLPLGNGGYAFIISEQGEFLAHPHLEMVMGDTILQIAENKKDARLGEIAQNMVSGKTGFVPYTSMVTEKSGWLAYSPIPSTKWSLGVVFSGEELMAKVLQLTKDLLFIGLLGFALLLILILFIARSITHPLRQLDEASRGLAAGNLEIDLPYINGDDEVAHLSQSFSTMLGELKVYMEMLEVTAAEKERIASELRIAHSIQMSLVPKTFPPFPEREEFELYAVLEPAREVGGDFYDFFLLDEENLCLVIGDVSGKGVPAAIFMAVTRTFLKALSRELKDPAAILERLNEEIVQENDSCMFVTLFCAVVNLSTGQCRYANGGHNIPFLVSSRGQITSLPPVKGVPVGAMEGMTYTENTIQLHFGEALFLYTDGVTEAENARGGFFGSPRLIEELAKLHEQDCKRTLKNLQETVHSFAQGTEQSDDITMLMFRFNSKCEVS